MQTLLDLVDSVADVVWSAVETMFGRFFSEASYRDGFLAGIVTFFVVGGLSYVIGYAWARINNFFKATNAPPKAATGPVPFRLGLGCAGGAAILIFMALLALSVVNSRVPR